MRVKLGSRFWNLVFKPMPKNSPIRGECSCPDVPGKSIVVDANLQGEEMLEVVLHECAHALMWHVDEEFIERSSREMARVLWRLGYRNIHEIHD